MSKPLQQQLQLGLEGVAAPVAVDNEAVVQRNKKDGNGKGSGAGGAGVEQLENRFREVEGVAHEKEQMSSDKEAIVAGGRVNSSNEETKPKHDPGSTHLHAHDVDTMAKRSPQPNADMALQSKYEVAQRYLNHTMLHSQQMKCFPDFVSVTGRWHDCESQDAASSGPGGQEADQRDVKQLQERREGGAEADRGCRGHVGW